MTGSWNRIKSVDTPWIEPIMDNQTTEITRYKEYVIEANPPKPDERTWGTFFVISRDRPADAKRRSFDDDKTFSSRLDAVHHCFAMGRKIIDGEMDGLSVTDL